MITKFTEKLKKATNSDLYQISLKSSMAKSGEVFIFEKGSLSDLFEDTKAEKLRKSFLKNKINVKQITNIPTLPKFSDNDEFVNKVMTFRYIQKDIFSIENEILIFDETIAIYNKDELLIIEDKKFANNQKQLFMSIWDQGQSPSLEFEYKPNHSYYKNLNYFIDDLQIIVWPDADAKKSYKGFSQKKLGDYIKNIISTDKYYDNSAYIIVFIWSLDGDKMLDVWKFNSNYVDDRSGPLGDIRVYREGKLCNDLELASGSTLIVLGYEEKLRRQSKDLKGYLNGPVPNLPLEIMNGKDYFSK
ncbi:hypothetical protein KAJ41_01315 [Candidatus Parcubacteria bacterium]|nr:hypothetical protein [Candidatus Parcubacteria bacterium]